MKKFLFLTGMILAMGAFQSLKAQTFSRVVTVGIDTVVNYNGIYTGGFSGTIYEVPPNKIFKICFFQKYMEYNYTWNLNGSLRDSWAGPSRPITINNILLDDNYFSNTKPQDGIWLKSGDQLNYNATTNGNQINIYKVRIFLSGIEYDAQ
jgi:hypothetical protein